MRAPVEPDNDDPTTLPHYGQPIVASGKGLERIKRLAGITKVPQLALIPPKGTNIMVVRVEPTDRTKGGIIIPNTVRELQSMGFILSVGHRVGYHLGPILGSTDPADYLGAFVVFGKHAGGQLMVSLRDDPLAARFVYLQEGDIWMASFEEPNWKEDEV
jgi:co-chaperonin GroES (HSP10)